MTALSLPGPEFEALIRPHTGDVADIQQAPRGFSSDVTAVVKCDKGPFFVKAMRNRPGGRRESLIREALINPYVAPVSAPLRWQVESEDWIALGFDLVDGRSSDFTPGSADLPAVVDVLNEIARIDLPDIAQDWIETRWDAFTVDEEHTRLLRGDALLHTDINPDNLLAGDRSMWAVDWSWPTRGAALIDPACLVVQLIASGHTAESAEAWAARCTAWQNADPAAIDVFAAAQLRMHVRAAGRKPDETWLAEMVAAVQAWVEHRAWAAGPPVACEPAACQPTCSSQASCGPMCGPNNCGP